MVEMYDLSYYENGLDFVVVKKRVYAYIFRNNGQIPKFSQEKEILVGNGFATYLGRILI